MQDSLTTIYDDLAKGLGDIKECWRYLTEEVAILPEFEAEIEERWSTIETGLKEKRVQIEQAKARRMVILVLGARTAVLAKLLAFKRESIYYGEVDHEKTLKAMDGVLRCIINDETWLWQRTKHVKTGNWPTYAYRTCNGVPCCTCQLAQVCRRSCQRKFLIPARPNAFFQAFVATCLIGFSR